MSPWNRILSKTSQVVSSTTQISFKMFGLGAVKLGQIVTTERKWDLLENQKDDMDGVAIPTPYLQQSSIEQMLVTILHKGSE